MDKTEFYGFKADLLRFIAETYPVGIVFHSCRIEEKVNLIKTEQESARSMHPKRIFEFSAGRYCARYCVAQFGPEAIEIPRGKIGEPLWPPNFMGSISHTNSVALATVVQTDKFPYIGVDLLSLDSAIENTRLIASDRELSLIDAGDKGVEAGLMLFSIKEAAIKVISSQLGQYIDFREIELYSVDNDVAKLSCNLLDIPLTARWVITRGMFFCLVTRE